MKTNKPLRNKALLVAAYKHIVENPEKWEQGIEYRYSTGCGCYLHWVEELGKLYFRPWVAFSDIAAATKLNEKSFFYLYRPNRTLSQIRSFILRRWPSTKLPKAKKNNGINPR